MFAGVLFFLIQFEVGSFRGFKGIGSFVLRMVRFRLNYHHGYSTLILVRL